IELFTLLDSAYIDDCVREAVLVQLKGKPVTGFFDSADSLQQKRLLNNGYMLFDSYRRKGLNGEGELALQVMSGVKGVKMYLQLKRDLTTEKAGLINVNPSFTAISEGFDRNEMLLGGYFSSVEMQKKQQVQMAASILNGAKVESIPMQISEKQYLLDWNVWRMLEMTGVEPPSYVKFVNKSVELENPLRFYGMWGGVVAGIGLCFLIFYFRMKSERKRRLALMEDLKAEKDVMELAIRGGGTYAWQVVDDKFVTDKEFWAEMNVKTPATRISDFVYYLEESAREEALQDFGNLTETKENRVLQARCDFGLKGLFRWWEFRFVTQRIAGKVRTMGLLLDIDQKKRYEEDMKRAREIAEKTELKHSFLTNISHEIRTPLNAIVGFTTVLHSGEDLDEEEKRTCLQSINENTEQLLSVVGDILDLSKFESGAMDMQLERYNAKDIVYEIYDGFKSQMSSRLEFKVQNLEIDAFITIDRLRFMQVINSFLSNASKFTTHGYVKLGCVLDSSMQKVHFYVEDSGVGIEEKELKMIFSRFYKQDEFSKGTGLGLALSKVIVEKLDGKLQVVSKVGVGSRFIVTLPCWRILSDKEILGE
ncbi:MAG: sensor histidine kinase, partial [Phocaeicola sp.]